MDRNLHDDYFERFLRDSVEDFRMIPSRRVWTSLYNNLHPGKKYPSLAVCVFLLSAIIYIGLSHSSNKNSLTQSGNRTGVQTLLASTSQDLNRTAGGNQTSSSAKPVSYQGEEVFETDRLNKEASDNSIPNVLAAALVTDQDRHSGLAKGTAKNKQDAQHRTSFHIEQTDAGNNSGFAQRNHASGRTRRSGNRVLNNNGSGLFETGNWTATHTVSETQVAPNALPLMTSLSIPESESAKKSPTAGNHQVSHSAVTNDREWIDNFAFYNKPKSGIRNKLTFQIYATPSIGFRQMTSNTDMKAMPNSLIGNTTNAAGEQDHSVVHTPALNLEAGYSLIYNLNKTLRIKGGMQFNYSNFYVQAQPLDHPMGASLLLNGPNGQLESVYKSSFIANNPYDENARQFSNNSFQVSLPIGADIRLAGNSKLQWFAGATIQPTYILTGNAFLLSDDNKSYIFDANFIRKWNLNAGIETFITYKVNKAVMINAGPQFRYQFRSSFVDQYTYDVKLYNLGIKLGVIQQF